MTTYSYPYNTDPTFGCEIEQFGASKALCNRAVVEVLTEHGYIVTDDNVRHRGVNMQGGDGWEHDSGVAFTTPFDNGAADGEPGSGVRIWTIKSDGSIRPDYDQQAQRRGGLVPDTYERWEVVSPPMKFSEIGVCQAILRRLNKYGARVNKSCGLHIHIDARQMSDQGLINMVKLAYKFDPILIKGLGVTESRLACYAEPVRKSFRDAAVMHWNKTKRSPQRRNVLNGEHRKLRYTLAWLQENEYSRGRPGDGNGRYRTVNFISLIKYGTVEFRLFDATMHAGRLKTAIQTVYGFASWANRVSNIRGPRKVVRAGRGRFDMRANFCIHAGMMGPELKTARKFLCENMEGTYDGRVSQRDDVGESVDNAYTRRAANR